MGIYTQQQEAQAYLTPEKITAIAKAKGCFTVSLRYRDDWLRRRCNKMVKEGVFGRAKRVGKYIEFRLRPEKAVETTV